MTRDEQAMVNTAEDLIERGGLDRASEVGVYLSGGPEARPVCAHRGDGTGFWIAVETPWNLRDPWDDSEPDCIEILEVVYADGVVRGHLHAPGEQA